MSRIAESIQTLREIWNDPESVAYRAKLELQEPSTIVTQINTEITTLEAEIQRREELKAEYLKQNDEYGFNVLKEHIKSSEAEIKGLQKALEIVKANQ